MLRVQNIKGLCFVFLVLFALGFVLGCGESPVYKIRLKNADFDSVALLLEAELAGANMRVFDPPLDMQAGMLSRGEEFPKYKVYQFCNLELGKEIFKITRDFGAFIPCKIYIYQDGSDVVVGTYLASSAMIHLDIPLTGEKADIAEKYITMIEDEIKAIMESLKE